MKPLKIQISSQLLRYEKYFLLAYNQNAAQQDSPLTLHLGEPWIFNRLHHPNW